MVPHSFKADAPTEKGVVGFRVESCGFGEVGKRQAVTTAESDDHALTSPRDCALFVEAGHLESLLGHPNGAPINEGRSVLRIELDRLGKIGQGGVRLFPLCSDQTPTPVGVGPAGVGSNFLGVEVNGMFERDDLA